MYDETQLKIINATMNLVMEKGYNATTTKDISIRAGVNECTIFRKFKGKKDIVIEAMTLPEWNPSLTDVDFIPIGNLEADLVSFSRTYLGKVTPHMVKVSLGLRTPELYNEAAPGIMKVPNTFLHVLIDYFKRMYYKNEISDQDFEGMAMQFLSMNFGFVFLKASFGNRLSDIEQEDYIVNSVRRFVGGILRLP